MLKLDSSVGLNLMCDIPLIVDEILYAVSANTNVYFKSYFEEYELNEEGEFPSCSSGLIIYLSKEDYMNNKIFRKIETNRYGNGGIYSHISVYRCGLMYRFHKFLFNECKEYFNLKNDNLLHRFRETKTDVSLDYARNTSRYVGVNFIFVPLSLEQEERLYRDFSSRDIGNS